MVAGATNTGVVGEAVFLGASSEADEGLGLAVVAAGFAGVAVGGVTS